MVVVFALHRKNINFHIRFVLISIRYMQNLTSHSPTKSEYTRTLQEKTVKRSKNKNVVEVKYEEEYERKFKLNTDGYY